MREKEWANAHLWADAEKLLAELTSATETNAQMHEWIETISQEINLVRQNLLVGGERSRRRRKGEELLERDSQLRASEDQLAFLRNELVRQNREGETTTMIRHVEDLVSLRLYLEAQRATNNEV